MLLFSQKNLGASFAIVGLWWHSSSEDGEHTGEWLAWLEGRDAGLQSQCLGPVSSLLWTF